MLNKSSLYIRSRIAFTLIELLVVIAILGMIVSISAPILGRAKANAESAKCVGNLRNVGLAVLSFVSENDNRFPVIETNPSNPVYGPEEEAEPLIDVLGPYGVTEESLRCPADSRSFNWFKKVGSSYEWRPVLDDELANAPVVYGRRGTRYPPSARIRLVMDFEGVHGGRANRLFADGHVK